MKIKIKMTFDDKGYIKSFCTVGNLEGSTEYEVDEEHFWANVAGYKLVNGELTFDNSYKKKIEKVEEADAEIYELKDKLRSTDYKALKFAEGWVTPEEYSETLELRKSWRDRINQIEKEIAELYD